MRGTTQLQVLWQDSLRFVCGAKAFYHYLRTPDEIQLGLGLFSAKVSIVEPGRLSYQYLTRIANVSRDTRIVMLGIEIYAMNTGQGSDTHCGHMTKTLTLLPRTAIEVELHYDWLGQASFVLGGTPSLPDEFWNIRMPLPQLCSMHAVLLDHAGNCLDRLTIYQEVRG